MPEVPDGAYCIGRLSASGNGYPILGVRGWADDTAARTVDEYEVTQVADPSFDVVSKVDRQEVDNALNQASKELGTRFDFRGTGTSISWAGEQALTLESETEDRARAAVDVLQQKLIKRGVSLKAVDLGEPTPSGKAYKINGTLVQGISAEKAKQIAKYIRDEGPKGVQAQIQGDQLRVSGKKKDHLQDVIGLLRNSDFDVALQFENFR